MAFPKTIVLAAVVVALPPPEARSSDAPKPPTLSGCTVTTRLTLTDAHPSQPSPTSEEASGPGPNVGPMTEAEANELSESLRLVDDVRRGGRTLPIKPGNLPPERAHVLLDDLTLLVALDGTQQLLNSLTKTKASSAPRKELAAVAAALESCSQVRFADRGGLVAIEQTQKILRRADSPLSSRLRAALRASRQQP